RSSRSVWSPAKQFTFFCSRPGEIPAFSQPQRTSVFQEETLLRCQFHLHGDQSVYQQRHGQDNGGENQSAGSNRPDLLQRPSPAPGSALRRCSGVD
ncbi:hypothetical protein INR49_011640, partial [Caranx melampygus]